MLKHLFRKKEPEDVLRDITDDVIEPDFVPYASHWDPYSIVTRNGEVLQTIAIEGYTHEQALGEGADRDLRSQIREAILAAVDSPTYAVWVHTVRRKQNLYAGGKFKRDFAGYLDRFWNDQNHWEHQFRNTIYITVVREGQSASFADPKNVVRGAFPKKDILYRNRYLDESAEALSAVMEKMMPFLEYYGARRLGVSQHADGVYYTDIGTFLSRLATSYDQEFPVADIDLATYLADFDITFAHNAMELRSRKDSKTTFRRFAAMLTLKEYREITPELLDNFLHLPVEFVITQSFHFISAPNALKPFEYQKELFDISKAKMLAERVGIPDIFTSNKGNPNDYGQHQITIFLPADTMKMMEAAIARVSAALSTLGMIPMREDLALEECFWAQLPANFAYLKRMRPINTARLGGFANLSHSLVGDKEGHHWGTSVTTLFTANRIPYFFNFHDGDNGHTLLIGPPSSGKSIVMNFLLAQTRKYNGKLFYFGLDRSAEIFLRSLNGAFYNPYPGKDSRPYAQVSLNPFQLDDTAANREFLRDWVLSLIPQNNSPDLRTACEKAIAVVMPRPKAERELKLFVTTLQAANAEFASLFAGWVAGGELAAIFDHGDESLALTDLIYGFGMRHIAQSKAFMPVFIYLLHRINLVLDGTPTIIVLDEIWGLINDTVFVSRLGAWLDMLRAKNAMVLFASEHIVEAGKSSIIPVLMPKLATRIMLPYDAPDPGSIQAFSLDEHDLSYLSVMNIEDRHFLLKRKNEAIVMGLNLTGMSDVIAVLSATPRHLEIMEEVITANGLQASQWMPKLLERI